MVKFIATDLDGTLLDEELNLPEEIFGLVEELHEKGILFAPASGRQYANLSALFAPVADKIVFICENGALVKYRGETLSFSAIKAEYLKKALDEIRSIPGIYPLLCGAENAYIEDDAMPFAGCARRSYDNCVRVKSLNEIVGKDEICKISVYDDFSAEENCIRVLPQRLPDLRTIISGKHWCDVSAKDSDKGRAMRTIRDYFSLKKEECVAFGDHMNDYEMLCECGNAFVTENAYPPLKKLIPRTVPANTEGGVLQKIKEIIKEAE